MEPEKTESVMALLFCFIIWLMSCLYYTIIIPLPEQPSVPIAKSFPAELVVISLVSTLFQWNPLHVVIGAWISQIIYNLFIVPNVGAGANIPGPFIARYTRFWRLVQVKKGAFHRVNQALHEQYGMMPGHASSTNFR